MRRLDRRYTATWAAWIVAGAAVEIISLRAHRPGVTLCAHIRAVLAPAGRYRQIVLAAGLIWFHRHLMHESRSR